MTPLFPRYIFMKGAPRMAFLWRKTKGLCVGPGLVTAAAPRLPPSRAPRALPWGKPTRPKPSPHPQPRASSPQHGRGQSCPHCAVPPRQRRAWPAAPRGAIHPCGSRGRRAEEPFCCHPYVQWHSLDTHYPLPLPQKTKSPLQARSPPLPARGAAGQAVRNPDK